MREVVFTMELKGKAEPVKGKENTFGRLGCGQALHTTKMPITPLTCHPNQISLILLT